MGHPLERLNAALADQIDFDQQLPTFRKTPEESRLATASR